MTKSKRVTWFRATAGAAAAALVLLLVGDRGALTAPPPGGIDPLEILNLEVRANAIVLLDSSGSMRENTLANPVASQPDTPAEGELAGDDPLSKLAIAKGVLRTVVQDNQEAVSFQFGRYQQSAADYTPETNNRFLYTKICAISDAACNTEASSFTINPGGCGHAGCGVGLFRDATFMNTQGTDNIYHLFAGTFFNAETVQARTNGNNAANAAAAVATPGTDVNPPYIDVQQITGPAATPVLGGVVRFMYRGIRWNKGNANASCGGFQNLVNLTPCEITTELTDIEPHLRPELPLDTNGNPVGYTNQAVGAAPGAAQQPPVAPAASAAGGIRASGFTPITESLIDLKSDATVGFDALWANSISSMAPKPKTFIIVLTDGDDSCTGPTTADTGGAGADDRALRAAYRAQLLYTRIVATDPASSVTTFVVSLGAGTSSTRANWIAWGGSGMTRATTGTGGGTQWTSAPADATGCATCQNAFVVTTAAELTAALQGVIDQGQSDGEFSDQQSITDSIFELVPRVNFNPTLADERYRSTLPVILQSTFVMPNFEGHLKAFTNNAGTPQELWDAGDGLFDRVRWGTGFDAGSSNGMSVCPAAGCTFDGGAASANSLRGGTAASITDMTIGTTANARLKRRIYTTSGNGVFTSSNATTRVGNLLDNVSASRVVLWPPDGAVDPARVPAAGGSYPSGSLDNALGIGTAPNPLPGTTVNPAAYTLAQLQSTFGACMVGGGTNHADCTVGGASPSAAQLTLRLGRARKEARQIILAYTAGARAITNANLPVRTAGGEILYTARSWPMAESTLAAPAVVSPPPKTRADGAHPAEYKIFTDGPRNASSVPVNGVAFGFGLREPDPVGPPAPPADANLEPVMTVVYHPANDMLHAFRAAPYPRLANGVLTCTRTATQFCGGEELWGFVPYDLLPNLKLTLKPATRENHVYMMANAVRVSDVFVPGSFTKTVGTVSVTGSGVWRTVLLVGRGIAGKYYTALDVTTPGPFNTTASLASFPIGTDTEGGPIPLWSRGNPDTVDGKVGGTANNTVASNNDGTDFAKMGQTWSVPAISFVVAANNTTPRSPGGVEFVAYTGSGFGSGPSAASEGSTFYALDMLTGDVVSANDVGDRASMTFENALVANPAAFNPDLFSTTGAFGTLGQGSTQVYYPDIHGRMWRTTTASPAAAPLLFGDVGNDQPMANAPALLGLQGATGGMRPHVFVTSGNDNRVAPNNASTPPFEMIGLRDDNNATDPDTADGVDGPARVLFVLPFPDLFRGTAQPATAFNAAKTAGRVFFIGNRYNPSGSPLAPTPPPCVSSFDGVLYALGAETGAAAYDLSSADDRSVTFASQRLTNVSVVGNQLVIDRGLNAQNPPQPPAPPVTGPSAPSQTSDVFMGSSVVGTIPYKMGSSVCK